MPPHSSRHRSASEPPIVDDGGRPSLRRAARALREVASQVHAAEPFRSVLVRVFHEPNQSREIASLVEYWHTREPGSPSGDSRYRWEINHRRGVPSPSYADSPQAWRAWRPSEQERLEQERFDFETRLILPLVATENMDLLCEAHEGPYTAASLAGELLLEAMPVFRRDIARHVQMIEPWEDTFTLWCLCRRPRVLQMFHPVAVALATTYAAGCPVPVVGAKYPFFGAPLCSASAQLASALLALGSDLDLVARLTEYVTSARQENGAWRDADEPTDVLTTLVAADLLGRVDPSFNPTPTLEYFDGQQRNDGLWSALGPEAPWLTREILVWAQSVERPFAERFRWPYVARGLEDQKTKIPSFGYFIELAELFAALPGLASAPAELAFIDLVGFRAFNNRFGQEAGDRVLEVFASALQELDCTTVIRDGGDEFLVVGAPYRKPLLQELEAFRRRWPVHFRRTFGADVPPVAPRIVVERGTGQTLRALRERLGHEVTALKDLTAPATGEGILVEKGS